ncbi:MAG: hypothetical protein PHV99_02035, partial [Candidatus Pacebacteria bacterium]|nr:hypothetical protein [Candidatus Paceibacterota bacterium]
DQTIKNQVAGASKANGGGTMHCNVSAGGAAYAVSAALVSAPGSFFCVDSTGAATTTVTDTLGATGVSC